MLTGRDGTGTMGLMIKPTAQMVRVFLFLRDSGDWVSAAQIAKHARVSQRAARARARQFTHEGITECRSFFPSFLYRILPGHKSADMYRATIAPALDVQLHTKG